MNKLKQLLKDKTFITLLLSTVFIVTMGALRPGKHLLLYPNEYWVHKSLWAQCADMVFAGDSRVYAGISPQALKGIIDIEHIYNYGYSANGYSQDYLQSLENLLNPKSTSKTIVLGISPHALTEQTLITNGFKEHRYNSKYDIFMHTTFPGILQFFEPMSFKDAKQGLYPENKNHELIRTYHADGWIASTLTPENNSYVKKYETYFTQYNVSNRIIDNIINAVSHWSSLGIKVYAFRPPAAAEIVTIENHLSGFDEQLFIEKFNQAGGTWLQTNLTSYHTFDASHLTKEEAVRFTKDLGERIKIHQ